MRRALERLGGRMQIAGAVIDDGDAHRCAPGSGNKPITSEAPGTLEAGGMGGIGVDGPWAGGRLRVDAVV